MIQSLSAEIVSIQRVCQMVRRFSTENARNRLSYTRLRIKITDMSMTKHYTTKAQIVNSRASNNNAVSMASTTQIGA